MTGGVEVGGGSSGSCGCVVVGLIACHIGATLVVWRDDGRCGGAVLVCQARRRAAGGDLFLCQSCS